MTTNETVPATPPRPPMPPATMTFDQTVPRAIAHRRAVGEVFITDSARLAEDEYLLAWQIPRAHSLWGDRLARYHDPFSVAEAARQGCFVVLHRHMGIAVGLPFSLRRFVFQVTSGPEPYRDDERWPLQGLLRYHTGERQFQGGELGSMTIRGELEIGGETVMTIIGDVVFLSRADYESLRAFQRSRKPLADVPPHEAAIPVAPAAVGRRDTRNIVVGEPAGPPLQAGSGSPRWPLVIDRSHPSYFDHDYDHVPGPFLVEGFRQAGLLAAGRVGLLASPVAAMTGLDVTFTDFGEFEAPLEFSAEASAGSGRRVDVRVGLHQFGVPIAGGSVELTPYP